MDEFNNRNNENPYSGSEDQGSTYSYSYKDINQGDTDQSNQAQGNPYQSNQTQGNPYQSSANQNAGNNWSPHMKPEKNKKEKKGGFGTKLAKVAAIALVFGLVTGAVFSGTVIAIGSASGYDVMGSLFDDDAEEAKNDNDTVDKSTATDGAISTTSTSTATTVTDVSDIVENVMPAVVAVTNVSYVEYRSWWTGQSSVQESTAAGSGIIVSQDDEYIYIATNNHVVADASTLTITFCDETAAEGTLQGANSSMDLAVVAVPISSLEESTLETIKVATIGDSDSIAVGESAIVIGNALGYGQSVTTGVISAKEREVTLTDDYGNEITNKLIQTDAAVNPGNSGGALLNMNGEVIGIVSAKYSDTDVEGMGYAIPITSAKAVIDSMITGEVTASDGSTAAAGSAYFGIAGADVEDSTASVYGMPSGVYVTRVVEGSAADEAGIEKGDIIVSFDGRNASSMDDLSSLIQYKAPGDTVTVVVAKMKQGYEEETVEVTLGTKES